MQTQKEKDIHRQTKLKGWLIKLLSDILKDTTIKIVLAVLSLLFAAKISDVLFLGSRITTWMQEPLTPRIIPITPLSIVLSTLILVATYHLHKFKSQNPKKNEIQHIDFVRFIWRIQKLKNEYTFTPLCMADRTELKRLIDPEIQTVIAYFYQCYWCGQKYSEELVEKEEHSLRSKITDFGIEYFEDRFIDIKKETNKLKPRPKKESL